MVSPPPLLWRRAVILFSWEVDDFLSKQKGKVALFFACDDLFFPLDSQTALIFRSMMRLTVIRVVTCLTRGWLLVQAERGQPTASLKMVAGQERLYSGIIFLARLGKYCWAWFVNEDDCVRNIGPLWVLVLGP